VGNIESYLANVMPKNKTKNKMRKYKALRLINGAFARLPAYLNEKFRTMMARQLRMPPSKGAIV